MISKARLFTNTFFLLAILLMITSPLSAQPDKSRQIDSLKALFPKQEGVEKIESLYELSRLVSDYDLDSAIYYDSLALDFLKDSYQSLWHVKLLTDLSYFHVRKFEYINAKALLEEALLLGENANLKRGLFNVYTDLGNYFIEINIYDSALIYHHKSLKIGKDIGERFSAISFSNIGLIYYRIKNFKVSSEYHTKALNSNLLLGDSLTAFTNYINIGLAYLSMNEVEEAKINFDNAIKLGEAKNHTFLAHAYDGLGRVFITCNKPDSARKYLLKSISAGKKFEDKRGVVVISLIWCQ